MNLRQRIAAAYRALFPAQQRMYAAARPSRLNTGIGAAGKSSADVEIRQSLTNLRAISRVLTRDAAYPKRAKVIIVNNVIGGGIGMQAQVRASRDSLRTNVNDAIEEAWEKWSRAEFCHTGGVLHFPDLERALQSETFEAGEVFVREHLDSFGGSEVPYALELVESERVPHEFQSGIGNGDTRMGIEVDQYYRPLRYWIRDRHPSDIWPGGLQTDNVRPVLARDVIHLQIVERFPQTRGVPWLHAVAKSLNDMDGYTDAEITAARGAANYMAHEQTPDLEDPSIEQQEDGSYQTELSPGIITRGPSSMEFFAPNRPNSQLDPFMRYMLRQVAAGVGVSYESLSRDYSQSNYSSSRLALLDDRDLWRVLQGWFIRSFRQRVHRNWLRQAVLVGAIPGLSFEEYARAPEKFEAVKFKPRGWGWVDPTKEVEAYKEAVRNGFTTQTKVISATGGGDDIEDVIDERKRELDMAAEAGLRFDTDVQPPAANAPPQDKTSTDQQPALRAIR